MQVFMAEQNPRLHHSRERNIIQRGLPGFGYMPFYVTRCSPHDSNCRFYNDCLRISHSELSRRLQPYQSLDSIFFRIFQISLQKKYRENVSTTSKRNSSLQQWNRGVHKMQKDTDWISSVCSEQRQKVATKFCMKIWGKLVYF